MSRTASVYTRIDPKTKAQAEAVLEQLGISMSTAMEMYLRQIAMQRKIPFEMKLPEINKPIAYATLSDEQFNTLMDNAAKSYAEGLCSELSEYKTELEKDFKL